MIKRSFGSLLFAALAGFWLNGCAGTKPLILPPYIRKIAVRPFSNHTQQYGLEDKLTLAVQSEFNRDSRIQITSEDHADGLLTGDITKYTLEPLSYDSNHVPTEYKLSILTDISFLDKVKNQTLWKESGMSGELRYFVSTSGFAGSMTEDDARQTIWDELSRDIATRTLEGFANGTPSVTTSPTSSPNSGRASVSPQDNTPLPIPNPQAPAHTRTPY